MSRREESKQIYELEQSPAVQANDFLIISQNNVMKKVSASDLVSNIGISTVQQQVLTDEQKELARNNIGVQSYEYSDPDRSGEIIVTIGGNTNG